MSGVCVCRLFTFKAPGVMGTGKGLVIFFFEAPDSNPLRYQPVCANMSAYPPKRKIQQL